MKKLSELSIADLMALLLAERTLAGHFLMTKEEIRVRAELIKRISQINFEE